jgi:hypothetical protein
MRPDGRLPLKEGDASGLAKPDPQRSLGMRRWSVASSEVLARRYDDASSGLSFVGTADGIAS